MNNWIKDNCVFLWTLLIAIGVIIFGAAYSSILGEISGKFMSWVSHYFGWLYILSIVAFIGFCVWIAMSKYGKIKLAKMITSQSSVLLVGMLCFSVVVPV